MGTGAAACRRAGGGTPQRQFPWVFKPSTVLGVHAAPIEIDHTPGRGWFRVRDRVTVRVREPVADQEPVTCISPATTATDASW